jgi:DNA-binding response OmpR family regulator
VLQKPFHIHQLFAEVQKLLPQAAGENSDSAR